MIVCDMRMMTDMTCKMAQPHIPPRRYHTTLCKQKRNGFVYTLYQEAKTEWEESHDSNGKHQVK